MVFERLSQPVTVADRGAVIALETGSFANPWTAEAFDTMLGNPVSHVYVARRQDASIVAFCACWVIEGDAHINTVAVDAGVRRQGIGSALVVEVLARSEARRATLEVRRSNVAAIALYEKLGFRVAGVRPNYYARPEEDGLILWLNP